MNDQELARLLRAAVNVNHSPSFLARVRAHAAEQPTGRSSWRWWLAPAATAACAAVVVASIAVWPGRHEPIRVPDTPPRPRTQLAPILRPAPPGVGEVRTRPNVRRQPANASRLPEVLISPDDARALGLLAASARDHRIPVELPADGLSASRDVILPRIDIPRVTIEPLPDIARLEGDRP